MFPSSHYRALQPGKRKLQVKIEVSTPFRHDYKTYLQDESRNLDSSSKQVQLEAEVPVSAGGSQVPGLPDNHGPVTDHMDWALAVVAVHTGVGGVGTDT